MEKLIALRVKEFEAKTGITCHVAADIGGFSHSTATDLLQGRCNPSANLQRKICTGFGQHIRDFYNSDIFNNFFTI